MDQAFKDSWEAKIKRREANRLRTEEMYNRDSPRVVKDLEDAAKQLEAKASGYDRRVAEDFREERSARTRIPPKR